jgi:hypothetical protein
MATASFFVPLPLVRWGSVFCGLAFGIALHLLLMVAGTALGLGLIDASAPVIGFGDFVWNAASMLVAAFFGGYVAARVSGMRRTADGLLHGAVAWGATTVLFAVLTLTSLGPAVDELFGTIAGYGRTATETRRALGVRTFSHKAWRAPLPAAATTADGGAAVVSRAPANRLAQAPIQEGPDPGAVQDGSAGAPGALSGWLAAAMLASLVVGLIGGAVGANGVRRFTQQSSHTAPGVGDVRGRRRMAGAS